MRRTPAETPLMRQYLDVKQRHPDGLLFFRLGDFYELFFDDALVASKALDLTLTTRDKGREDAVPMCGVPHHAARGYIARLAELGHKVVICEQVEDPRLARGIVKREVTRVITPGIVLDEEMLDASTARYLAAVTAGENGRRGLAYLDVTTGEFVATELASEAALIDEVARVAPRELLVGAGDVEGPEARHASLAAAARCATTTIPRLDGEGAAGVLREVLGHGPAELGLVDLPLALRAAGDAVAYARATQPAGALPICRLVVQRAGDTLVLDEASKTNLEVVETIAERRKEGSLLGVLDDTRTAPGGRLLRRWLLFPLLDVAQIRRRQDAVELLVTRAALRREVRTLLSGMHDLARLVGRVSLAVGVPRDLVRIRTSLEQVAQLGALLARELTRELDAPELVAPGPFLVPALAEIAAEIAATIVDEPPPPGETGVIRAGRSKEIDELRVLADGGKGAIVAIEARERERTGIGSLKVRYNRVFGYYIEITRSNLSSVPTDYLRKQTLANAERFSTPELAELEVKVLSAEEQLAVKESELTVELGRRVAARTGAILAAAEAVATLDVCASLAEVAHRSSYVRPTVDSSEVVSIDEGRHPVVEQLVPRGSFVANDVLLDPAAEQILVVTGPNMAGKSTYMRQVAQIVLLAQTGSFVPARRARIGVVDRIFTRVGAADNLARGESTFMVEMRETAAILRHATRRSLVLLDEIGRGTSTYDGVSIAWAVAEYLHDAILAKTLFATHYHELAKLAKVRPRVRNVSVAVSERDGRVVFLRRVVPEPASRSYGIEVAMLAGIPRSVVGRARQLLGELERPGRLDDDAAARQLSLLAPAPARAACSPSAVELALAEVDPERVTPIEALTLLVELRRLLPRGERC